MQARETIRKLSALPPEAQTVVLDLLETLAKRYAVNTKTKLGSQMKGLRTDPFIGMWRDRAEMAGAAEYVHTLRRTEWQRGKKTA